MKEVQHAGAEEDLEELLVGCAALTGWGAVTRTAAVEPGASVAVWGCGGVGLATIQAARLAGAGAVVAVDTQAEKLELAERLGATSTVLARPTADTGRRVRHATGGGVDFAFEAIGREETIREVWEALRPGGTAVVVGLPPKGSTVTIDTWGFINEKTIKGCFLGSARIDEDVPRLLSVVLVRVNENDDHANNVRMVVKLQVYRIVFDNGRCKVLAIARQDEPKVLGVDDLPGRWVPDFVVRPVHVPKRA